MLRLAASVSVLALLSGAAIAADLPTYSPPPAPMLSTTPIAYNWSGFYIGAHGGWGFGSGDFDDGFVVGGQLGVNWQFNNFVDGAEGDGSFTDWGNTDAVGTVRLRAGFALDRFMPYITGGAAFGDDIGWVAGGGVQYALTDNLALGVEYLHYDFDDDSSDVVRGRLDITFNSLFGM
jgi:outer membrane immunogenic protein